MATLIEPMMGTPISAETYFREMYLSDWTLFSSDHSVRKGPSGILCGMTMVGVLGTDRIHKFNNPQHFLCVQYELNLLNQAIYTYCRDMHYDWTQAAAPFADCRCASAHGGVYTPESIYRYAEQPAGYPEEVSIVVPAALKREFDQLFVPQYLTSSSTFSCHRLLSTAEIGHLKTSILADPDYVEFRRRYGESASH